MRHDQRSAPVARLTRATAQALETAAVLVTYDAHFAAVPGLRLWDELA